MTLSRVTFQKVRPWTGSKLRLITKGLVTNYGEGQGATKREGGGHMKFYPYEKGEGGSLSHAEGGSHKVLGVVFTR